VPGHGDDVLFVAAQQQHIAHHAQVKDAGGVVTGACCHEVAENRLEHCF
jgi:hypothetical protein